ncbi:MAG TPA: extracellular solute-binding protein [Streptosporangiaceae bacterium]|nr:extracellular solute-binding protein [Streptosporangiaceae bacterium]
MMISRKVAVVALLCIPLAAAGCSSSSAASGGSSSTSAAGSPSTAASSSATGSGPVNVLYAGSLVNLMQKQVGPAFQQATGYSVTGFSGGSKDLAAEIKGKVHQGDVFVSASPKTTATLVGAPGGNWVSWYGTFATSALVIGYNANSKFANDLKTMPWYKAITQPGLKLGFTDPATDPKGVLAVQAMTDTAKSKNLPALTALSANKSDFFPEETLVGRLQSGQLDAGFFYTAEATAANIPTVPLTGEDLKATYTITILNKAPHEAGAEAFVKYLLGPAGQAVLKQDGFTLVSPPTVTGSGVPSGLSSVLPSQ